MKKVEITYHVGMIEHSFTREKKNRWLRGATKLMRDEGWMKITDVPAEFTVNGKRPRRLSIVGAVEFSRLEGNTTYLATVMYMGADNTPYFPELTHPMKELPEAKSPLHHKTKKMIINNLQKEMKRYKNLRRFALRNKRKNMPMES